MLVYFDCRTVTADVRMMGLFAVTRERMLKKASWLTLSCIMYEVGEVGEVGEELVELMMLVAVWCWKELKLWMRELRPL